MYVLIVKTDLVQLDRRCIHVCNNGHESFTRWKNTLEINYKPIYVRARTRGVNCRWYWLREHFLHFCTLKSREYYWTQHFLWSFPLLTENPPTPYTSYTYTYNFHYNLSVTKDVAIWKNIWKGWHTVWP